MKLTKKTNAPETEQVNNKISELNQKIKEYTEIYDNKQSSTDEQIQNELNYSDNNVPVNENEG